MVDHLNEEKLIDSLVVAQNDFIKNGSLKVVTVFEDKERKM